MVNLGKLLFTFINLKKWHVTEKVRDYGTLQFREVALACDAFDRILQRLEGTDYFDLDIDTQRAVFAMVYRGQRFNLLYQEYISLLERIIAYQKSKLN